MGSGTLWDDLGSTTFVTAANDAENTGSFTYNAKRRESFRKIVESPDDELDFLSSGSRSDDVEQQIPIKSKPRTKKKQPGKAVILGRTANYHPDHLLKKKLPDFKKITAAAPEQGRSSTPRSKTFKATQKALKQTKSYGMLATLHNNENERLSQLSDGSSSDNGHLADDHDSSHTDTPRGCMNGTASCRQSKPPHNKASSQSPDVNCQSTPTSPHASGIQSLDSDDSSEVTPRAKHLKLKSRVRKFPTLDPLSISDSMVSQPNGGKSKVLLKGATDSAPSQTHRRTLSSLKIPLKYRKSRYPFPSPLSSPVHQPSQDSAIALRETNSRDFLNITTDDDADDESPKRRLQLRPFPMAATQLKATSHTPRRKTTFTQQVCPDNDRSNPFSSDLEMLGDDSFFIGESADPSSLCPFCDEKLPPNPSPFYCSLLEAACRKAYPDPRPTNPRGLRALMGIYVASCKRHRFETYQIPEAMAKGWPMNINFGKIRERVERLTGGLTKLVRDEGNAREESIYWTTVMKEVRKLGSRAASGVKGQFESFEKTQPGYYGELGSMILHQTLYNLFPPPSFDAQSIMPLTPQEFIQRILVPEAALALIMEDTGQDRAKAVQTMRESAGYGVAMFPDTSEGPDVGAGEDIVLERARARRRELEDEERMEALLPSEDSEDEHHIQAKGTKRPKMLSSAATTDIEETTAARRRMKRKKAGSRTDAESGPDGHAFHGSKAIDRYTNTAAISSNLAADSSHPQSSPPQLSYPLARPNFQSTWTERTPEHTPRPQRRAVHPKPKPIPSNPMHGFENTTIKPGASLTAPDSQSRPDMHSMGAPIDVDDPRVIDITDTPSPCEQQPSIPVGQRILRAQGPSDAKEPRGHCDLPKPKPRPRRRMAKRGASVDRRSGQDDTISPPTSQSQRRDSSVEIVEPPPNHDRLIRREITGGLTTLLNDDTGQAHTRAQRHPTSIRTRSSSGPRHERHEWLMSDSD